MLSWRLLFASCLCLLAACGDSVKEERNDIVSITISGAPPYATGGGTVEFNLAITNVTQQELQDYVVAIRLGQGMQLDHVECPMGCFTTGGWLYPSAIAAGATLPVKVVARIDSGFRGRSDSTFGASVKGDTGRDNNESSISTLVYAADLSVTGSASANEYPSGTNAIYTMTVVNAGPDTAPEDDLMLVNTLSTGQSVVSIQCAASGKAKCPGGLSAATLPESAMSLPSMPSGGTLVFTITAKVAAGFTGAISDTLRVDLHGDQVPTNNEATASATARITASPGTPSFVALRSEDGDTGERVYRYDQRSAILSLVAGGGSIQLLIAGEQGWSGELSLPGLPGKLRPGVYASLPGVQQGASGHFSWSRNGRPCSTSRSQVTVDTATWSADVLTALDLRFEQHCDDGPVLHGQVHWVN